MSVARTLISLPCSDLACLTAFSYRWFFALVWALALLCCPVNAQDCYMAPHEAAVPEWKCTRPYGFAYVQPRPDGSEVLFSLFSEAISAEANLTRKLRMKHIMVMAMDKIHSPEPTRRKVIQDMDRQIDEARIAFDQAIEAYTEVCRNPSSIQDGMQKSNASGAIQTPHGSSLPTPEKLREQLLARSRSTQACDEHKEAGR